MNPRLLIYAIGIIFILFMIANIFKSARTSRGGDVKKKFDKKDRNNIEDADFKEEK